jgi:hypothetical protein
MGKLTEAKLLALKETVPHCSGDTELPDKYAEPFASHSDDGACLCCGECVTFTWGLAHGEGHCYKCGWPARLYHFIKDETGKETRIVRLLQYHPSVISLRGSAS